MSIYTDEGYKSRRHYLEGLAFDMDIPLDDVLMLASVLGSSEDFDGLVTHCEDHAEQLAMNEERNAYE
jgi:hypothetical protein